MNNAHLWAMKLIRSELHLANMPMLSAIVLLHFELCKEFKLAKYVVEHLSIISLSAVTSALNEIFSLLGFLVWNISCWKLVFE